MKLTINQKDMLKALSIASKGLPQRAEGPMAAGVLVEAGGETASFQATDLVTAARGEAAALVDEPGSAVLPGKLLLDMAKSLPDAAVTVEARDGGATVACGGAEFSIRALDPEGFPAFPQLDPERQVTLPHGAFSSMARKVCRVASRDEGRMVLTGVLVEASGGSLKLVATDSYRLAVAEREVAGADAEFSAILPSGFVADLASIPDADEAVTISLSGNQVAARCGGASIVSRRIEGRFPDYARLIPAECPTCCTVNRHELASAVKRAALLDASGPRVRFAVDVAAGALRLDTAQDAGTTLEAIAAEAEGEDAEAGFNSFYVAEGLSAMEADTVTLGLQGALKPGVMTTAGDERFLYLIMPMML